MKKRKNTFDINNFKTFKIGYLGSSALSDIKDSLSNHLLFHDKKIEVYEEKDLLVLLKKLREDVYNYIIVPSRNEENEVNDIFLSLISRIDIEGINEIGMFISKINYDYKISKNDSSLDDKESNINHYKSGDKMTIFEINDQGENKNSLEVEYRIFKKNEYKTPRTTKFGIWLLKNNHLKHILEFLSGFIIFAMLIFLVFRLIPEVNEKLEQISILVELIATSIIVLLQVILRIANTEETIKRKMIVGYWVYYSFEETNAKGKFVPRGFKTRLVEISNKGDNLSFKCKFEGEDEIFFATDTLTFDYDLSSQMGRGFYYYTSNVINNDGKRAEGTCRFEGETIKNNQIMTMNGWFFSRGTALTGKVKYFRISEKDYYDLQLSMSFYKANIIKDKRLIIGIYGTIASNTDVALKRKETLEKIKLDNNKDEPIEFSYFGDVESLKKALLNHQVDYIIVPIENRGEIIKKHDIFQDESIELIFQTNEEIIYYLGVTDGNIKIDENTIFYGHPLSLYQCKDFIKDHHAVEESSSSMAALNMSKGYYGRNAIVLCNKEALKTYNLTYLKDENDNPINPYLDKEVNITKFNIYRLKK